MRILFITPYLPSLIRVRPYNFIKVLKKNGHSVYLISLVQDKKEIINFSDIENYCEKVDKIYLSKLESLLNCVKYLFTYTALQSAYCFSNDMNKHIDKIIKKEKFDVIHVEHIRASHFLPIKNSIPSVYDSVDCITALYKQFSYINPSFIMKLVSRVEWYKLEYYEPKEAKKFNKIIVTSEFDKKELIKLDNKLSLQVVSNGVDLKYFKPENKGIEPYSVVMTGKMSYFANELAALFLIKNIWPDVKKKIPQAKLYIVGNEPGKRIKKFASSDIIITGYVPDIRVYLAKASVVAVPIVVGVGIQNKVIEAMAMGKAVVATEKACEAFSQDINDCLLIKKNAKDFSKGIIELLNNTDMTDKLGKKARNFIKQNHNWDEKGKELANIYRCLTV